MASETAVCDLGVDEQPVNTNKAAGINSMTVNFRICFFIGAFLFFGVCMRFVSGELRFYGFSSTSTAASVARTETLSPTLTSARLTASLTWIVLVKPSASWRVTV